MSKIRKILLSFVLVLIGTCGFIFAGCTKNNYSKVDFSLSDSEISLTKVGYSLGESKTVTAKIKGTKNDISKKITFVSANPEVATVEEVSFSGDTTMVKVTAQGGGSSVIYAIAEGNVKKIILVSVSQEASQIVFNPNYKPLIVRGEKFILDFASVLVYPSSTSDKSFDAKLYDQNNNFVADFSKDVNGNLVLNGGVTSQLLLENYFITVSKETSMGKISASTQVFVNDKIDVEKFSFVDLNGEEINLNLSTNTIKNSQGETVLGRTSLKFRIKYEDINGVVFYNPSSFVFNFLNSENFEITYHELNGNSYYEIQAKHQTDNQALGLNISYPGFENEYSELKSVGITITTYPEKMIIVSGGERFVAGEDVLNIYTNSESTFTIINNPLETKANNLLLEISSVDFAKFEVFKINNQIISWAEKIYVNVGDVITVKGLDNRAGDTISLKITNRTYSEIFAQQTIAIRKAVEIDSYYTWDGTMFVPLEDKSFTVAEGTTKDIYFTVEDESAYFEGFSFISSGNEVVVISSLEAYSTLGDKTVYRLRLSFVSNSNGNEILVSPQNQSVVDLGNALQVKVVTAVDFSDAQQTNPRIYFVNNSLDGAVNIGEISRDPNGTGDVWAVSLNDKFLDGVVAKGRLQLNLLTYPNLADVELSSIIIKIGDITYTNFENGTITAVDNNNKKITVSFLAGVLTIQVEENGWDESYSIDVKLSYYNRNGEEKTLTKTISLSAYKRINYSDLKFLDGETQVENISLISKNTAGESFEKSVKELTFTLNESSLLIQPSVQIRLASETTSRVVTSVDGEEWTILEGDKLTLMYRSVSSNKFNLIIFSNNPIESNRYNDFIIATVSQEGVSYNKFVQVEVVNNSVSSQLVVDESYKTDSNGQIYYVFKRTSGDQKIDLNNRILPYSVQGVGYNIISGEDYLKVENGELFATGAGANGIVRIYAKDKRVFENSSVIDHFVNDKAIRFTNPEENFYFDVAIRVEDGSENAPYSVFTSEDFLNIKNDSSNLLYFDILSNLNITHQSGAVLGDVSNVVINGNNKKLVLENAFAESMQNVQISNLTLILGNSSFVQGAVSSSNIKALTVYSDANILIGSVIEATIISASTFVRGASSDEYYFGIAEVVSASTISNNELELKITSDYEFALFAGIAGQVTSASNIVGNKINFFEYLDGKNYKINLKGENSKGAIVAFMAEYSNIVRNEILSYLDGSINNSNGEFAGVVHSAVDCLISYNSLFVSINGPAAVYEIIQEENNFTNISNNNFVVANGINGKIVERVSADGSIYSGLIQNTIYFNKDNSNFDETGLVILSKNLFVRGAVEQGEVGDNVVKLLDSQFEDQSKFFKYNALENYYVGLAFTSGVYESYQIGEIETIVGDETIYQIGIITERVNEAQHWVESDERPVLCVIDANGIRAIEISKANSINITEKGSVIKTKPSSQAEGYLHLLPESFNLGEEINLADLFDIQIDDISSSMFDFVITEGANFEKTANGNIKVNGYGYLKLKIYAKTNASVIKEIVLFVYENNIGKVYNASSGEEILNDSTVKVRKNETFSFFVVSGGLNITISGASAVGNGFYIVQNAQEQTVSKQATLTDGQNSYQFNLNSSFNISVYSGATNVNISFDKEQFTEIDKVNATISVSTDKGEISEDDLENYLSITRGSLPELSKNITLVGRVTESTLGVEYTTSIFNVQFYFANFDNLTSNTLEGEYLISVAVDEINVSKAIELKSQKILTEDYTHFVQGDDSSVELTDKIYEIDNKPIAYIVPGSNSILDLFIYPFFADFSTVTVESNTLTNSRGESIAIAFEQKVLNGSSFETHPTVGIVNGIYLDKKSTPNEFNGHFFVKTLLTTEGSYYLNSGDYFILTFKFYNGDELVHTSQIEILVESINSIDISLPEYMAVGVETPVIITEPEQENVEESFDVSLIIDGVETTEFNRYITGPYESDGSYFVYIDINLFYNNSLKNKSSIKLKIETVATKMIKGIYQTSRKSAISDVKKFLIDSIELVHNEVYLSSDYIPLTYRINATYYQHADDSGVPNGAAFTANVEQLIENLESELNDPSNYFGTGGQIKTNSWFEFNQSNTWAWKLNDEKHEELKIYSLVYNASIDFETKIKIDYDKHTPALWMSSTKTYITKTASMAPKISLDPSEDHPEPIYTIDQFRNIQAGQHYRLMNNLVLEGWEPMDVECLSLDGNGFVIYIQNFNINMEAESSAVEIGLFKTVSSNTLLKNIIVGYGDLTFDVISAGSVSFGGLAVTNRGAIYNCEVLAMNVNYNSSSASNYYANFDKTSFVDGDPQNKSTLSGTYVSTIRVNVPSSVAASTTVAGLVANNEGSISNSRVGRTVESFKFTTTSVNTTEKAIVGHFKNAFKEFVVNGNGFNLISTGVVAGFVGRNASSTSNSSNTITASYVANLGIENLYINTNNAKTAGFIGSNNGDISGCFVYGRKLENDNISNSGSSIYSATHVGGFVYENFGSIDDCLSNIKIITNAISAGFCYDNGVSAKIENCISLSANAQSLINNPFIGHNGLESLNKGQAKNCYYFDENGSISVATEDKTATAIKDENELKDSENYNGYAFGENNLSVWIIKNDKPILVSANEIAVVHYTLSNSDSSTYNYYNNSEDHSPRVISSGSEWHKLLTALANGSKITGSFRVIKNIDFSGVDETSKASLTYFFDFAGKLDANGLTINNVSVVNEDVNESIGLFASINKANSNYVVVKNLNVNFVAHQGDGDQTIAARNTTAVGGLAGIINNASIYKISLNGNFEVLGGSYVGGLAGIVMGDDTIINNVKSTLSARALEVSSESVLQLEKNSLTNLEGFVGAVAGLVDVGSSQNSKPNIINVEASNVTRVVGSYVGGVFGFIGQNTFVHDVCFIAKEASEDQISVQSLIGYETVGGISAINLGRIRFARVEHENQEELDQMSFNSTYLNSSVNLFRIGILDSSVNKTIYVGGIVGVNINDNASETSGVIQDSYNKVAVIPAYNNTNITSQFDLDYDRNSLLTFDGYTTYAGGLVGLANGARIETSFATSQVVSNFAGGVVGRMLGSINLLLVNVLTNFTSGLGVRNYLVNYENIYPAEFFDSTNSNYYAVNSNYKVGTIAGYVDAGTSISLEGTSIEAVTTFRNQQTGNIKFFGEFENISQVATVDGEFNKTVSSGDFVPANLVETASSSQYQVVHQTLQQMLLDVEGLFMNFDEVSHANWVLENFNENQEIPYPNFGIVSNPTITNGEQFAQIINNPTANFTIKPSSDDYTITVDNWVALAKDFTGSIHGAEKIVNGETIYPTIKIVLDASEAQYVSIFEAIRRSTIEDLNIVFVINGSPKTITDNYFGAVAARALDSKITNVTVSLSSQTIGETSGMTSLNVSPYKYFGGLVSVASGTVIRNSKVDLNITDDASSKAVYIGGLVGTANNCKFINCEYSASSVYLEGAENAHFGGIVAETTEMGIASISSCSTQITSLELATPNMKYVGGLVGHASADFDTSNTQSGASIVGGSVKIDTLNGSADLSESFIGGVVGFSNATVDGTQVSVKLNVLGVVDFGGVVGFANANISNVIATVFTNDSTNPSVTNLGGIAGTSAGEKTTHNGKGIDRQITISNCAASISVNEYHGCKNLGGIVGLLGANDEINECFANVSFGRGNLISSQYLGGIAGRSNSGNSNTQTTKILNCYSAGDIAYKLNNFIGGIVGWAGDNFEMQNCYSVCDIGSEADVKIDSETIQGHGTGSKGLLIGSVSSSLSVRSSNNFAIRECNMELFAVGSIGASNVISNTDVNGVTTCFISEFYNKIDTGFSSGIWDNTTSSKQALPQLRELAEVLKEKTEFGHKNGSRINPTEIEESNLTTSSGNNYILTSSNVKSITLTSFNEWLVSIVKSTSLKITGSTNSNSVISGIDATTYTAGAITLEGILTNCTFGTSEGGLIGTSAIISSVSGDSYIEKINIYVNGNTSTTGYFVGYTNGNDNEIILKIKNVETNGNANSGLIAGSTNGSNKTYVLDGIKTNVTIIYQRMTDFGSIIHNVGSGHNLYITNSYNIGDITYNKSTETWGYYIGGIAGNVYNATIKNSFNIGDVALDGSGSVAYVGGLVGCIRSNSLIENCFNVGYVDCLISTSGEKYVGGLVGALKSGSEIKNSYSASMRSNLDSGANLNGITGSNNGILTNVYYANDLLFNDTNSFGTACDYAELQKIYTQEKLPDSKWASLNEISTLPFLKIGEFESNDFAVAVAKLSLTGSLFAPNKIDSLSGSTNFGVNYLTKDLFLTESATLSKKDGILLGGNHTISTTNCAVLTDSSFGNGIRIIGLNINATLTDYSEVQFGALVNGLNYTDNENNSCSVYINNVQAKINGNYFKSGDVEFGGLIGVCGSNVNAKIYNSSTDGSITGTSFITSFGGLVGNSGSILTINKCYSTLTTLLETSDVKFGGLVGNTSNILTIMNSYFAGFAKIIDDTEAYIGSIVGYIDSNDCLLEYCYDAGVIYYDELINQLVGGESTGVDYEIKSCVSYSSIWISEYSGWDIAENIYTENPGEATSESITEWFVRNSETHTWVKWNGNTLPTLTWQYKFGEKNLVYKTFADFGYLYLPNPSNTEITSYKQIGVIKVSSYRELNNNYDGNGFYVYSETTGVFSGTASEINNVSISNLGVDVNISGSGSGEDESFAGLMFKTTANLTLENCWSAGEFTFSTNEGVGGLIGSAQTLTLKGLIINNCSVAGGNGPVGGVVGSAETIELEGEVINSASITGGVVGGIAGNIIAGNINSLTIKSGKLENSGVITGSNFAGGIAGTVWVPLNINGGEFINRGTINGGSYSGGIIGSLRGPCEITGGTLTNYASVTGSNTNGGIIGTVFNSLEISGSASITNYGTIKASSTTSKANRNGGIIGDVNNAGNSLQKGSLAIFGGTITNNAKILQSTTAGGIVGESTGPVSISGGEVTNGASGSYYNVSASSNAGGIVGYMHNKLILGGYDDNGSVKSSSKDECKIINYLAITATKAGGIVGYSENDQIIIAGGTIENHGEINAESAGGIVGSAGTIRVLGGEITNKKTITISEDNATAGGVCGQCGNVYFNGGNFTNNGSISSSSPVGERQSFGGFIGKVTSYANISGGQITNKGLVNGYSSTYSCAGGIFGYVEGNLKIGKDDGTGPTIKNEAVILGHWASGGIVGLFDIGDLTIAGGEVTNGASVGVYNSNYGTDSGGIVGCFGDSAGTVTISGGTLQNGNASQNGVLVSATDNAGGIFGGIDAESVEISGGSIINNNKVTNADNTGGIIGYTGAKLTISGGTITNNAAVESDGYCVGGIVGYAGDVELNGANISNVNSVTSTYNGTAQNNVGGIIGKADNVTIKNSTITNGSASFSVTAQVSAQSTTPRNVGGIIGHIQQVLSISGNSTITNRSTIIALSSNSGDICVGGIFGYVGESITFNSESLVIENYGNCTASGNNAGVCGGIIGDVNGGCIFELGQMGQIKNYAEIKGYSYAGGIIGRLRDQFTVSGGMIYNHGDVNGGDYGCIAGILGRFAGAGTTYNDSCDVRNYGTLKNGTTTAQIYVKGGTAYNGSQGHGYYYWPYSSSSGH